MEKNPQTTNQLNRTPELNKTKQPKGPEQL